MTLQISFAIPLYNKAGFIFDVITSIGSLCSSLNVSYEIVVTDNCSSDLPKPLAVLLKDSPYYNNIVVYNHPCTISSGDNWMAALALCSGEVVKLQLADDKLLQFDLAMLLSKFQSDQNLDYIIGKSLPVFEDDTIDLESQNNIKSFFDIANNLRRKLAEANSPNKRLGILFEAGFFFGSNPLQDSNSLFLAKRHVDMLRGPILAANAPFFTWADWEIFMKTLLPLKGLFWDEFISEFSYNSNGSFSLSLKNKSAQLGQFVFPRSRIILANLIDPYYASVVYPQFSIDQKRALLRSSTDLLVESLPCRNKDSKEVYPILESIIQRYPSVVFLALPKFYCLKLYSIFVHSKIKYSAACSRLGKRLTKMFFS